ncbi:hypothetical protein KFE25_011395 [Diacronema lutheri]|uniref:Thiamine pyrophosphokinase n=1 Tax=Diacronema lutheri TaxID=2081491 RepID=A0A8J5XDA2_DIALT|nr:hypothetical protein KFE25_011395 [Diacronema lutheri]
MRAILLKTSMRAVHSTAFLSSRTSLPHVALVFLNSEGAQAGSAAPDSIFERAWRCARVRVCADGAANRLHDGLRTNERRAAFVPDLIKGDLDSLRTDVRAFYAERGVRIEQDTDEDHHDLDKCLMALRDEQAEQARALPGAERMTVVVLGAFGGRLDQQMANLNMLFRWQGAFAQLLLLSEHSAAFLLAPGEHTIEPNAEVESAVCGLVPLGAPCASVRTSGLRWNLCDQPLAFGGMVSTSNEVVGREVHVQTDGALLWTTVLRGSPAL